MNIGILVFDGAEELDLVGPWEVFATSRMLRGLVDDPTEQLFTVAPAAGTVRCAKGMRIVADHPLSDHPPIDVLLVPGGQGTRTLVDDPDVIAWIARVATGCSWVTSVCTGALLLHAAGPARGRSVATHWGFEDQLAGRGEVDVVRDRRWVVDGTLVTSQGVSAGIDMALWLVGQWHGADHARAVQRWIQYDPAPPYADEHP